MSPTVVVIGAGQAGLSISRELTVRGVAHVVLERGRIGNSWRGLWDSFCLVTPNWTVQLPGSGYDGVDPDGFMIRDELPRFLERYAASFAAPVHTGVDVHALEPTSAGFVLRTSTGDMHADAVVVATGSYHQPPRPAGAETLPHRIQVLDADGYRNPERLAPGKVLVVGSGQTGCQLAEELSDAGRDVVLACGRAPWRPRRIGGRDVVRWVTEAGFMDQPRATLPSPEARLLANAQATGKDGGHDLHYRTLLARGVVLVGRFLGVDAGQVRFASDLARSVAFGDARYDETRHLIRQSAVRLGVEVPEMPDPEPFHGSALDVIDAAGLAAVVFTSGLRPDYASWVRVPGAFDSMGFPIERDGTSTIVPGLYFCGVHFMRTRKSSLLGGVGEDAVIVARAVVRDVERRGASGAFRADP